MKQKIPIPKQKGEYPQYIMLFNLFSSYWLTSK